MIQQGNWYPRAYTEPFLHRGNLNEKKSTRLDAGWLEKRRRIEPWYKGTGVIGPYRHKL